MVMEEGFGVGRLLGVVVVEGGFGWLGVIVVEVGLRSDGYGGFMVASVKGSRMDEDALFFVPCCSRTTFIVMLFDYPLPLFSSPLVFMSFPSHLLWYCLSYNIEGVRG